MGLALAWFSLGDRLPLRVAAHFDTAGRANGWTARGDLPWLIFGLPVGVWLLLWLMDLAMLGGDSRNAQKMAAMPPARGLVTLGTAGISLAMVLIPLHGLWLLWVALAFLLICLGVGIWESLLLARVQVPTGDEKYYLWGLFYVNPQDDRIWTPKQIGLGWTLNFGRPAGWLSWCYYSRLSSCCSC